MPTGHVKGICNDRGGKKNERKKGRKEKQPEQISRVDWRGLIRETG